jgi:hypothetical protein
MNHFSRYTIYEHPKVYAGISFQTIKTKLPTKIRSINRVRERERGD